MSLGRTCLLSCPRGVMDRECLSLLYLLHFLLESGSDGKGLSRNDLSRNTSSSVRR